MTTKTSFGFLPVISSMNEGSKSLSPTLFDFNEKIEKIGGQKVSEENLLEPEILLYFIQSGGTENDILNFVTKRRKKYFNETVFLIAFRSDNSLAASLEILARLHQDGLKGKIFFLSSANDNFGLKQMVKAIHYQTVHLTLRKIRLGLIGDPSSWLIASSPNTKTLTKVWGPEVIKIKIKELEDYTLKAPSNVVDPLIPPLVKQATQIIEPTEPEIRDSVNVYSALKKIVDIHKLDAVSLKCFDLVNDLKTTGCYGLSQLLDDGIVAGCEGDLVSTVGMLWANILLNEVPWMANPSNLDINDNKLTLAHCTVPRKIVGQYKIRSHFESKIGFGIQADFDKGPVTIFRLGGKNMELFWGAEGEVIENIYSENLCRTQVDIKLLSPHRVEDLLNNPLGNHLIFVKGCHLEELTDWWNEMINHS